METNNKQFQIDEAEKVKRQQKRKALLFYPAIGLFFIGVMYLIFLPSKDDTEETNETVDGYNANMPLPTEAGMIGDKKSAYELAQLELSQQEKRQTLDDYATELNAEANAGSALIEIEETENKNSGGRVNSIRQSNDAYRSINRELQTFYEPSKDTEKEELKKKVEELTAQVEANETGNQADKQLEIMEKSYQIASRYLNGGQSTTPKEETPETGSQSSTMKSRVSPVVSVKKQIVSGLEQNMSDSVFMATFSQNRNLSFITAVGKNTQEAQSGKNTIRACLYADQTLVFGQDEGEQYVSLRLLEPMQAGNMVLPRNSIVSGAAKLQSGRIGLQIVSIEYQGYVIPVELTVYDVDGQPGINAPGSAEVNAIKEAAANAGAGLGTSVSFTQNAGQQVAMDLTKGIMQSGSQYLSKKIRTAKINLKAGYQVFLLIKEN